MNRFEGQVIVVSGTRGPGVGSTLVRLAQERGARVVGCDLENGDGPEDEFVAVNLRDPLDAKLVSTVAFERFGRIDIVIANACLARRDDGDPQTTPASVVVEAFCDNFLTAHNLVAGALPVMEHQRRGSIVLVSSINARAGGLGQTGYSVAKAGLEPLAQILTSTHGPLGIRTNVAMLGTVPNFGRKWQQRRADEPQVEANLRRLTPRGRLLTPDEAAAFVLSLAGDDFAPMFGQVVVADGGLLAAGVPLCGSGWRQQLAHRLEIGFGRKRRSHEEGNGHDENGPSAPIL